MTVKKKIKTINPKIEQNKAQYDLSSENVGKYEFLTGKEFLQKKELLKKAATMTSKSFTSSPFQILKHIRFILSRC